MLELAYVERTADWPGGPDPFIDAGVLAFGGGDVLCEFGCSRVQFGGDLGPAEFDLLIDGDLAQTFGTWDKNSFGNETLSMYGQCTLTYSPGSYSQNFALGLSLPSGNAICSPPMLPAWFRVVANPFALEVVSAAISHTFGLN